MSNYSKIVAIFLTITAVKLAASEPASNTKTLIIQPIACKYISDDFLSIHSPTSNSSAQKNTTLSFPPLEDFGKTPNNTPLNSQPIITEKATTTQNNTDPLLAYWAYRQLWDKKYTELTLQQAVTTQKLPVATQTTTTINAGEKKQHEENQESKQGTKTSSSYNKQTKDREKARSNPYEKPKTVKCRNCHQLFELPRPYKNILYCSNCSEKYVTTLNHECSVCLLRGSKSTIEDHIGQASLSDPRHLKAKAKCPKRKKTKYRSKNEKSKQ